MATVVHADLYMYLNRRIALTFIMTAIVYHKRRLQCHVEMSFHDVPTSTSHYTVAVRMMRVQ